MEASRGEIGIESDVKAKVIENFAGKPTGPMPKAVKPVFDGVAHETPPGKLLTRINC
jgi:hypothetical protein